MKIFSSFDTNLKQKYKKDSITKYGEENIFIMERSKLYFYIKIILRIVYGLTTQTLFTIVAYNILHINIIYISILGLFFSSTFYIIAIINYIDYKMNYVIFTPDEATLIEQLGIFNRHIKSLDIKKIKSISIQKSNFFFSLFNDGLITIMSERNDGLGKLKFKYVHNPEYAKEQIHKIIILAQKKKKIEY